MGQKYFIIGDIERLGTNSNRAFELYYRNYKKWCEKSKLKISTDKIASNGNLTTKRYHKSQAKNSRKVRHASA